MTRDLRLLVSGDEVRARTGELAREISREYAGQPVLAVCVLKGAFLFFADLVRRLDLELTVDFVRLASYGDATCPSEKTIFSKDLEETVQDRHLLVVEDIVDTGRSMACLTGVLSGRGPKSLKICALVDKQERREVQLAVDFAGFDLTGQGFLVGYGMDFAERYRELDGIFERVRSTTS